MQTPAIGGRYKRCRDGRVVPVDQAPEAEPSPTPSVATDSTADTTAPDEDQ